MMQNGKGRPQLWVTNEQINLACRIYLHQAPPLTTCKKCLSKNITYGIVGIELQCRCLDCEQLYTYVPHLGAWH